MSDVKLLPCPMCAGRAKWDARTKRVWCFGCGLSSRLDEKAPAIAAWNARPAPALTPKQEAADEMFDALEAMLQEKDDYMRRNHLGNPEHETVSKVARAALAKAGRA